ncbi:MAG TPA: DUF6573 family protein [Planctomycetota bacterium]|nr:DUF6573 family protein [Planctomycetota bacterium]
MSAPGTGPFGDVVHRYTRADAIADGVLVDVTREASPAEMAGGFAVPVAVTAAVWAAIEAIPASLDGVADVRGRLHDVLWMAACAARRAKGRCAFRVHLPVAGSRAKLQRLVVHLGPGDAGEPVVTIGHAEDM